MKKEPVTIEMLATLFNNLGQPPLLCDLRLAASCLLFFAGFLKIDELARLRCCGIKFSEASMTVHIIASKTDQYWQGDSIMVTCMGTSTCPVAMTEKYYASASLSQSSSFPLFRGITRTKSGEQLCSAGSLSYT